MQRSALSDRVEPGAATTWAGSQYVSVKMPRALAGGELVMYHRYALWAWFKTMERERRVPQRRDIQGVASRRINRVVGI